jgi:hypothetical protein
MSTRRKSPVTVPAARDAAGQNKKNAAVRAANLMIFLIENIPVLI